MAEHSVEFAKLVPKIDRLTHLYCANLMLMNALLKSHPDAATLRDAIAREHEVFMAVSLGTDIDDTVIEGGVGHVKGVLPERRTSGVTRCRGLTMLQ